MADLTYEKREKLEEILNVSNRLNYLINFYYRLKPEQIISIRVDSENRKIDVNTEDNMYRFKMLDLENALIKDADTGIMKGTFDPALVQGIMNIIDEFA